MPAGKHKSRSLRRVFRRTPGGKTKLHYKRRKPGKAKCILCSSVLSGVPNKPVSKMMHMPRSKKRPERLYGGSLCTKCARKKIVQKARTDVSGAKND